MVSLWEWVLGPSTRGQGPPQPPSGPSTARWKPQRPPTPPPEGQFRKRGTWRELRSMSCGRKKGAETRVGSGSQHGEQGDMNQPQLPPLLTPPLGRTTGHTATTSGTSLRGGRRPPSAARPREPQPRFQGAMSVRLLHSSSFTGRHWPGSHQEAPAGSTHVPERD